MSSGTFGQRRSRARGRFDIVDQASIEHEPGYPEIREKREARPEAEKRAPRVEVENRESSPELRGRGREPRVESTGRPTRAPASAPRSSCSTPTDSSRHVPEQPPRRPNPASPSHPGSATTILTSTASPLPPRARHAARPRFPDASEPDLDQETGLGGARGGEGEAQSAVASRNSRAVSSGTTRLTVMREPRSKPPAPQRWGTTRRCQ